MGTLPMSTLESHHNLPKTYSAADFPTQRFFFVHTEMFSYTSQEQRCFSYSAIKVRARLAARRQSEYDGQEVMGLPHVERRADYTRMEGANKVSIQMTIDWNILHELTRSNDVLLWSGDRHWVYKGSGIFLEFF